MNNPYIDQAREWAEWAGKRRGVVELHANTLAAVEVIQSLPDQWIDAEKLREVIAEIRGEYPPNTAGHQLCSGLAKQLEALLAPPHPLPTLADMTPEERERCQWMQCSHTLASDYENGVIIKPLPDDVTAQVLLPNGALVYIPHRSVVPLPDLPKLEWPGSHADTITAESVEDVQAGRVADFEPALPRPEDVPAGEPWLVKCAGAGFEGEWIGTRSSNPDRDYPWLVTEPRTQEWGFLQDSKVTLVSRLVPEVE